MMSWQLFHLKNVSKSIKNQQGNGRMDFWVTVIRLLCFLHCISNHQTEFEIFTYLDS